MELPYSNLGLGGCDNYTIFKTLTDNIEMINDDDIVIIGITYNGRFDIPINDRLEAVLWDWEERLPQTDKDKNFRKEKIVKYSWKKLPTHINIKYG